MGQDPFFSQRDALDNYINPALSFNKLTQNIKASIDLSFRDQWNAVSKGDSYTTVKMSADYNLYNSEIDAWNVGAILLSDRSNSGFLKHTFVRFLGHYTRQLSSFSNRSIAGQYISFGSSIGFAQNSFNTGGLWYGRQYDKNLLFIDSSLPNGEQLDFDPKSYFDLNLGLRWEYFLDDYNYYMVSIGMDHLNQPTISSADASINLDTRISFLAEVQSALGENFYHKGSILSFIQGPFLQIVPGYRIIFGVETEEDDLSVALGVASRVVRSTDGILVDAFIVDIGLNSKKWKIDFSFDMNNSDIGLVTNTNGAIELSLAYFLVQE